MIQEVHEFHQNQGRQLWSMYQSMKEHQIVARGMALGYVNAAELPSDLRQKLDPFVEVYDRHDEAVQDETP